MTEPSQSRTVFKVERTSLYSDETAPCPEARKDTIENWDHRTFKSPEEHDAKLRPPWHERGTEHKVVYGPRGGVQGIERRVEDRTAWFVEIDSLEALMAFHEKHGDLVLKTASEDGRTPTIEIYDDYRE